jgi:hypothetical protein
MNRFDCNTYCPDCGKEAFLNGTCQYCGYDMPNLGEITGKIVNELMAEYNEYGMMHEMHAPSECGGSIHRSTLTSIMDILDWYDTTARAVLHQLKKRCSYKWIYTYGLLELEEIVEMEGGDVR